jgi:serpin B
MRHKRIIPDRLILIAFVLCYMHCAPDSSPDRTQNEPAAPVKEENRYQNRLEQKFEYADMKDSPLRQLAADNAAFGMSLYSQISKNPGNVFFSPYSISEAFALLYAGAKGETAAELENTLHITLKDNSLHAAYRDMLNEFDDYKALTGGSGDTLKTRIDVANGFWAQNGFPLRDDFVGAVRHYHRAEPATLDFAGAPKQSCTTINEWISDRTLGMIKNMLSPSALNSQTTLVMANTIYFEAKWQQQFTIGSTKPGEFHRLDNTTVNVPLMNQQSSYGYTEQVDWQAAEILYYEIPMTMLIILPRPGKFSEVERLVSGNFLASLVDTLRSEILELTIPKFKFTSPTLDLKESFKTLGLQMVFTEKADLSGISTQKLILSNVFHKATVTVDEEETKAGAATALRLYTGRPTETKPIEFTADRPFIFLIRDLKSRAVLFMGRVVDPS